METEETVCPLEGNGPQLGRGASKRWGIFAVLLLIVLLCLSLWYTRHYYRISELTRIDAQGGMFDLTGVDLSTGLARLQGEVEYIPGILTPEEFALRESEAQVGNPWYLPCATSRIRIRVPEDRPYTITAGSIDFAHRAYVNGVLRFQAGVPAASAADFVPGSAQMTVEVWPEDGVIELIQQGANFVHREGGGHSNLYFGRPERIQPFLALTFGPEYIVAGLFAALFLMHLVLYAVRRSYRPNLIFSLLCLTWMARTGITNAKVFYAMFPALPWQAAFRAEYLSMPIASFLMVLLAREIFPGIPQRWFVRTMGAVSAVYSLLCLTADTVFLSWAILAYECFFTLSIVYLCARFAVKVPGLVRSGRFRIEQTVSLMGFLCFMAAGINDALYHAGVLHALGFTIAFSATGLAMLIFSLFQMTAMFYGTMREAALAHERERRAQAEKDLLSELDRHKTAFYADVSHEMKTPLTVIAVNAEFAAQNVTDEETAADLASISAEASRLAQMVTGLVRMNRLQAEGAERTPLALDALAGEIARMYQSLLSRKGNTLEVHVEPGLPQVRGNAERIGQVLINLLSNANRHTKNGTVTIRAEAIPGFVRLTVADTGEGISPELLPRVFRRFVRGDGEGTGLGLPICKDIVETHGGEIGIESEPGKGTRVWFTLPLQEKEETEHE